MKTTLLTVALLTLASLAFAHDKPDPKPPITGQIEVFFSPKGGCTDAVVKQIDAAKESILVQAYLFASKPIAKGRIMMPLSNYRL
jgi:hypothetical protein